MMAHWIRTPLLLLMASTALLLADPAQTQQPRTIICDIGGVLLATDKSAAFEQIGLLALLNYTVFAGPNGRKPNNLFFDTLNAICPRNPGETPACDEHGILLPQLMCDWLKGTAHPTEISHAITYHAWYHAEHFLAAQEALLFNNIARLVFTIDSFINTRCLIEEGMEFLQNCKEQGHPIYLLSNWDPYSFGKLQERFPELFQLCDGSVISGDCGLLKPDPKIYMTLLEKYNLQAKDCLFLDDQRENVIAAQKLGITSVLIEKDQCLFNCAPDFTLAYAELGLE
jgi:HAD superfamily hydrolase (TIGR01509 family)